MRSFLVTFKAGGKGIDFIGDLVADLPDDISFDKVFIDRIKADVKTSFDAKLAEGLQPGAEPPTIAQVVILAVIPLEAPQDVQDALPRL